MKHLEWFNALNPDTQASPEAWGEIDGPQTKYQDHYVVKDVAKALCLSPVTVRQYIREGKLFARKLGRGRYIPADAIARFIYNETHEQKAADYIPMGIVLIQAGVPETDPLIGYRILSDKELVAYPSASASSLREELGIPDDTDVFFKLRAVLELDHVLEDIGLVTPNLRELQRQGSGVFYSSTFEMPPMMRTRFLNLAFNEDRSRAPVALVGQTYKDIFGKEPDANDLRLLRRALLSYVLEYGDEARLKEVRKWSFMAGLLPCFPMFMMILLTREAETSRFHSRRVETCMKDARLTVLHTMCERMQDELPNIHFEHSRESKDRLLVQWRGNDYFNFPNRVPDGFRFEFVVDLDLKRSKRRESLYTTFLGMPGEIAQVQKCPSRGVSRMKSLYKKG